MMRSGGSVDVSQILASVRDWEELQEAGIVFHGTCEPFDGPPRPGHYDGVLWSARTPSIAQAYIPSSGLKVHHHVAPPFRREDPISPTAGRDDTALKWALRRCGKTYDDLDVQLRDGRVSSWKVVPGMPTIGDFDDWLLGEMGYEGRSFNLKLDAGDIRPAAWRMEGRLFVCHLAEAQEANFPAWEQTGVRSHNRTQDFARLDREGVPAFLMPDQLQSEHWGNVGHLSVGILPNAVGRLSWIEIPALRNDGPEMSVFSDPETPEFLSFMAEINPNFAISEPSSDQQALVF